MNIFFKDLYLKFLTGNITIKFIYISVLIEFLLTILDASLFTNNKGFLTNLLSLKTDFYSVLTFPFSLFTYVLINDSFFSLLFNLVTLYYVSNLFLSYFRENNLVTFSILGIIGSGLLFLLLSLLFKNNLTLVGLTPMLLCLLFAIIAYRPMFYVKIMFVNFPLQLRYIGFFLLGLELLKWIGNTQNYTHLVSFGSSAIGYFYMKQFEIGNDFIGKFLSKLIPKKNLPKTEFFKNPPKNDFDFQDRKAKKQIVLNSILDKISTSGYDSLTKEEKEFLFKKSKE
ncbi:MAG: DUF6576 domain-containing protein [Solirubrobacteraceae bacterium]